MSEREAINPDADYEPDQPVDEPSTYAVDSGYNAFEGIPTDEDEDDDLDFLDEDEDEIFEANDGILDYDEDWDDEWEDEDEEPED